MNTKFLHYIQTHTFEDSHAVMRTHRGYTAAYMEVDKQKAIIGISECGNNDTFCKKIGRLIAEGRMKSPKKAYILELTVDAERPEYTTDLQVREFCNELYFRNE